MINLNDLPLNTESDDFLDVFKSGRFDTRIPVTVRYISNVGWHIRVLNRLVTIEHPDESIFSIDLDKVP